MIIKSTFKPAWWMSNAHLQTIYSSIRLPVTVSKEAVEKIETPDGDFFDLVWSNAGLASDTPLVVILHGLGGNLNSSYVGRFMQAFNKKGWRAVLMHFRGAGSEINRLPRAYHSGDTADLDFLMRLLGEREPLTKKAIVGVSLGGNVLLKWLGEQGAKALVNAAVAVSVPFILNKVSSRINQGFSRVYEKRLLRQLRIMFAKKAAAYKEPPEALKQAAQCRCFWTFDDKVTAPLNGFSSAHDYYRKSSSRQYLLQIAVPTLIIQAKDDPFMTAEVLPKEDELSEQVELELSEKGGHVGFIAASRMGRPLYWLDERIPEYLAQRM